MENKRNVIAFMNMKGGLGKTTICVNIAGQLAEKGYKILVIDNDLPMNASQYLLSAKDIQEFINKKDTIYKLYSDGVEENFCHISGDDIEENSKEDGTEIIMNSRTNLDIVCGDLNMTKVNGNVS